MRFLISCFGIMMASLALGQSPGLIDSLENHLNQYGPDDRAFALFTLVTYYQRSDQAKTLELRKSTQKLLSVPQLKARTYAQIVEGIYYSGVGHMDSAEFWFARAKKSGSELNDKNTSAIICSSLGRTLISAGKADEAVSNLMEGLRLVDLDANQELAMKMRINLTWAFLELKRFRDAINYGRHTLGMLDEKLKWMSLYLYNNIAICYGSLDMLDSAGYFVNLGIKAAELNHDYQSLANGHFILGTIYGNAGRNDLAIKEYEMAKPFREKVGNPFFIVSDLYTMSSLYQKVGNYDKGIETGLQALAVAQEHALVLKFENTYQVLALNYEGKRDYVNASKYYKLWAAAKDSVYQHANAQAIADMETKYETEKKEQQIALQNATISAQKANIERNYIFIIGLAVVVILILVILLLIRSRLRRKQVSLKREYELSLREAFISATIQSQENERKRFAQDLHDGMGQLISALRFIVIRRDTESNEEKQEERLTKAEGILDDMHREIRGVAFNLMPQMLIRSGLVPALQEMAGRINLTGQVKISINSYELPERFDEMQEISLYRIVQEWINNVLKYAGAQSIQVQLVAHNDEVTLTVEDNGRGFDKNLLINSSGNGWKNIQSRMSLIKANVEVDTLPERKGTTLIVTMPWRHA